MGAALVKIAGNLLLRLATETFAAKVLVYCLSEISKSTNNTLDDKVVASIAEALNVSA